MTLQDHERWMGTMVSTSVAVTLVTASVNSLTSLDFLSGRTPLNLPRHFVNTSTPPVLPVVCCSRFYLPCAGLCAVTYLPAGGVTPGVGDGPGAPLHEQEEKSFYCLLGT